jgi:hypothetical protein
MNERNARQKNKIRAQARSGSLTHAWLLLGGSAGSREELTEFLASALLCSGGEPPCGVCQHCVKMAKGIHPDFIRMEKLPDRVSYVVDQVRDLSREAYVAPNEAARRVFCIPAADEMNAAAQNAMLKLLEEPPARSVFILAAEDEDAVLETVRSRCTALYADGDEEPGDADKYALALFDSFRRGAAADVALAAWQLEKAKLEREEFDGVLEALTILLAQRLRDGVEKEEERRLFAALDETKKQLRRRRSNNTGAGHAAGALAVAFNRILAGAADKR